MTRNLKALGLALLAICALGAVAAQGASAAQEHEFHSENERVVSTGKNNGTIKFQVGAAGTVECKKATSESTQIGTLVSVGTYKSDTATLKPHYSECTFGGQPATVNTNHCSHILDSDTTGGTEEGKEHANVEIECAHKVKEKEGDPTEPISKIEIHTAVCTITVAEQVVPHAVRYKNGVGIETTAKNIVTGKVRNTGTQPINGCLTFPTGAIGTLTGTMTTECFADKGTELTGTEKTTPTGLTTEGESVGCTVSPGA